MGANIKSILKSEARPGLYSFLSVNPPNPPYRVINSSGRPLISL